MSNSFGLKLLNRRELDRGDILKAVDLHTRPDQATITDPCPCSDPIGNIRVLPAPWMLNRSPRSAVSALGLCPLQSCSSMHIAACSSQESAPTTWHQPYPRLVRWMSRSSHIQNQNPAFAWLFETTAPALGIVGPDLCPSSALASSSLVSELILQQATNGLLKICPDGLLSSSVRSLPRRALVLCCCTCRFNWILPRLFSL